MVVICIGSHYGTCVVATINMSHCAEHISHMSVSSGSVQLLHIQGGGSPSAHVRLGPQNHNNMQIYQPTQMTLSNCMGLQLKVCYAHE